jgi:hypothetical protein
MNVDAAVNVVVFEVEIEGQLEKRAGQGPTRADDCIQQIWTDLQAKESLRPEGVRRIYSEWEPSAADKAFLDATFPDECQVTYSFRRPATAAGWDEAMRQAEEQIRKSAAKRVVEEELSKENNQLDDLMPVLRTTEPADFFAEATVNRPVGPGLGVFLAHVNWTPRQTIGTRYVMNRDVKSLGKSADELMAIAFRNFASGLQVEAGEIEGERVFLVKHPLDMGASAIGLPNFHANASGWAEAGELFVGFPNPSVLFVTRLSNTKAFAQMRQIILTSDYWGAVALTPACYHLDGSGLNLIAARPNPEKPPSRQSESPPRKSWWQFWK